MKLISPVLERNGLPGAAASLVTGGIDVGKEIVGSSDIQLGTFIVAYRHLDVDLSELHRL